MNNGRNKKELIAPERLNENQVRKIAGGERLNLKELCSGDELNSEFLDMNRERFSELVTVDKASINVNQCYWEVDENDPDNLDKFKAVFDYSIRCHVEDLSPKAKAQLDNWGIL